MDCDNICIAYVVDIVENADASLLLTTLPLLSVVGLSLLQSPRVAPLAEGAFPWGGDPLASGGPIPAIDDGWLEILAVTTFEVALPASCPGVVKVLLVNEVVDPVLLSNRVNGNGVHAELAAVVPGALPVPLGVGTNC